MSSYQDLGNGVYRVGGMRRSAVTGRYITKGDTVRELDHTDNTPLVTQVRTVDTAWNLYIGAAIQVRELNTGEVQFRMGDQRHWTHAGFKEVI